MPDGDKVSVKYLPLFEDFDQAGILYLLGEHLHWLVITGLLVMLRLSLRATFVAA